MTTKGGYYILEILRIYGFNIQIVLLNFLMIYVFVLNSDCERLFKGLEKRNGERMSKWRVFCLKYVNSWLFFGLLIFGCFYTENGSFYYNSNEKEMLDTV